MKKDKAVGVRAKVERLKTIMSSSIMPESKVVLVEMVLRDLDSIDSSYAYSNVHMLPSEFVTALNDIRLGMSPRSPWRDVINSHVGHVSVKHRTIYAAKADGGGQDEE